MNGTIYGWSRTDPFWLLPYVVSKATEYCHWARLTATWNMDLSNVHGHIFFLTDYGFYPYEYQIGPVPDLSEVDNAFLPELADYPNTNNLSMLVGLQVIDQNPAHMLELILPQGTVMLDVSNLNGCVPPCQFCPILHARLSKLYASSI